MNLFSRPDIHINLEGLNEQATDLAKINELPRRKQRGIKKENVYPLRRKRRGIEPTEIH
jgi:hypothetical protein